MPNSSSHIILTTLQQQGARTMNATSWQPSVDTALFHCLDVPLHNASTGRTRNIFIAILNEGEAAKTTYHGPDADAGCLHGLCGEDPKAVGSLLHPPPHHCWSPWSVLLHLSQSLTVLLHSPWAPKVVWPEQQLPSQAARNLSAHPTTQGESLTTSRSAAPPSCFRHMEALQPWGECRCKW